ncbi:MAG: fatty acid--CoA ligase family protein [Cycloclasticus sp.]|nr:fatty acid--CoA ligase family protein [Cycloclasticus sp.]
MLHKSFLEKIKENAELYPSLEAFVSEEQNIKYSELHSLVINNILLLRRKGVTKDSIIGLSIEDPIAHMIILLSLLSIGAGYIALSTDESVETRLSIANGVDVTVVVSLSDGFKLNNIGFILLDLKDLFQMSRRSPKEWLAKGKPGVHEQFYIRTSGTTSGVSFVPLSEEQLVKRVRAQNGRSEERLLKLGPLEFSVMLYLRLLYCADTVILRQGNSLSDLSLICEEFKVTKVVLSRVHLESLARFHENSKEFFPLDVKVVSIGSAVPWALRKRIIKYVSTRLYVGYGTTESSHISVSGPGEHDVSESSGFAFDEVKVEVVGNDDIALAQGLKGNIRLKAIGGVGHYYNDPEKSAEKFRKGWFYPGDIGYLRQDGSLVVVGRSDDVLIMNGLNIDPSEVEAVLEAHPCVRSAAVVGLPSEAHGQIPVAAVTLNEGVTVTNVELKVYARDKLGAKAPRKIIILDGLPFSRNGKVLKKEIRAMF